MSEQDGRQASTIQRPPTHDPEAWKAYWKEKGQGWRTEPEIDIERQNYLNEYFLRGKNYNLHPFRDIILSRADVEWLLIRHRAVSGVDDWRNYRQWQAGTGLDLQGANLCKVNLAGLPLETVNLRESYLDRAILSEAHLDMAVLCDAHLERAVLRETDLQGTNLSGAHFERAILTEAHLEGTMLAMAYLEEANLSNAYLERTNLVKAHLERANLGGAHLEGAYFYDTHLEEAKLRYAHLERANLGGAYLGGSDLSGAFFSSATTLDKVILSDEKFGCVSLRGVRWGDVDLSVIDWGPIKRIGDEQQAQQVKDSQGKPKEKETRIAEYKDAVRANRQLAVVLRAQGLNEEAARFAYRAQLMQRKVFWYQGFRSFGQYLFSLFLDLLTGYGYKPIRSFITYAVVISLFAYMYFLLGPHLAWNEAIVISMTAFHGRGFFPEQFKPGDPQALVAAIEAFVGLLIEVTFIATLTQRLFGK